MPLPTRVHISLCVTCVVLEVLVSNIIQDVAVCVHCFAKRSSAGIRCDVDIINRLNGTRGSRWLMYNTLARNRHIKTRFDTLCTYNLHVRQLMSVTLRN
jgi:hypothetical protein